MKVGRVIYLEAGEFEELVKAVVERVQEGDVKAVAVASRGGKSALRIAEALKGAAPVVSVTEFTYSDDVKKRMKKLGVKPLERVELPIQDRRDLREGLLLFGEGVKAALEAAVIAAGEGLKGERVIAVAGEEGGINTALVVRAAGPEEMVDPDPEKRLRVLEVLALPLRG
ncbi:hypothetical protein CW701_00800 [Candidatus Bathyarchaeota archaeon]|nr:MAG: hypothetical protein CW701_00800 [Candidatus Bathyarchaeota archaeon]